jgi:hypothetical protein
MESTRFGYNNRQDQGEGAEQGESCRWQQLNEEQELLEVPCLLDIYMRAQHPPQPGRV